MLFRVRFLLAVSVGNCRGRVIEGGRRERRIVGVGWEEEGGRLTLIIFQHVAFVVAAAVVGFAHGHGVVGEVDIAVVTCM